MRSRDPQKYVRMRTTMVGIALAVGLVIIGVKAVHIQVFQGKWLSEKAASQYERSMVSQGKRGTIFDAKMRKLAVSIDVTSIGAQTGLIKDKGMTAVALAGALRMNIKALRKKLTPKKTFVWIKRHVTPKETLAVRKLDLPGIEFVEERSRFYPYKTLAAQVLGFSGIDGNGLEGIEYYFDQKLKGAKGKVTVIRDALGRGFDSEQGRFSRDRGQNLVLTVDRRIQFITEKALEEAVLNYNARSGLAIVMAPETGAILAMANYPFFNPNNYRKFKRDLWRNRSLTDPFEPGSTMKIFSVAAAIEQGNHSASSIFYCENGKYRIGRNTVHDTKKHGWLTVQQIVKYSSNIGAVKIGEVIGSETLYQTLRDFGFGSRTGIDCPGETNGSLAPFRKWTRIDAGTIAFGQGVSVSALQLVSATAAIANDGVLMKPYLVQAVTDQNGRLLKSNSPRVIRRAVSSHTARTVARMMQSVVMEGGTGTNAALDGYTSCGKTGTAQKIGEDGKYAKKKYISSFVGFAPVENPKVAILVLVDEPVKYHYGGTVAAPAFKKIAHGTLDYMNVPPKNDSDAFVSLPEQEARI